MSALTAFALAFVFSFVGTIPPGTLNLSVLQLGLQGKIRTAWYFALAASLTEYPYCWLAIRFEEWITSSPAVVQNFERIGAIVMLVLGAVNLYSLRSPVRENYETKETGFLKGLLLGILNPLAMPYWIGITAYLKSQQWLVLDSFAAFQGYLLGVVLGALVFFMLTAIAAQRISVYLRGDSLLRYLPAAMLIGLGVYGLASSFL